MRRRPELLETVGLINKIQGTLFHLLINSARYSPIIPRLISCTPPRNNTATMNGGSPQHHPICEQLQPNSIDDVEEGNGGDQKTEIAGELQGNKGEGHESVEGKSQHLFQGIFRLARLPHISDIGDSSLPEADPAR